MATKNIGAEMESVFRAKVIEIAKQSSITDPAHDIAHFSRVVRAAKSIAVEEGADLNVVIPAAWLHDFVNVPKNDPRRSQASRISADAAIQWLSQVGYPKEYYEGIFHAIEAHSFSANIATRTLEAMVVQDADRLDAVGAIGIARCFAVGTLLGRPFYDAEDPWAKNRPHDDLRFTIDHFFVKLFKLKETMKTEAGKMEAAKRCERMKEYLDWLAEEA